MNSFSFLYWIGAVALVTVSYLYGKNVTPILPFITILILAVDSITTSIIDVQIRKPEPKNKISMLVSEIAFWIGLFISFLSLYYDIRLIYLGLAIILFSLFEQFAVIRPHKKRITHKPKKHKRKRRSILRALFGSLRYEKSSGINLGPYGKKPFTIEFRIKDWLGNVRYKKESRIEFPQIEKRTQVPKLIPKLGAHKVSKEKTKHRELHKPKLPKPKAMTIFLIIVLLISIYLYKRDPTQILNTVIITTSALIILLILYGIFYHIKHLEHRPKKHVMLAEGEEAKVTATKPVRLDYRPEQYITKKTQVQKKKPTNLINILLGILVIVASAFLHYKQNLIESRIFIILTVVGIIIILSSLIYKSRSKRISKMKTMRVVEGEEETEKVREVKEEIASEGQIAKFRIKEKHEKSETELDELLSLVNSMKRIKVSDAAKKFGVPAEKIEEWAEILEEHHLITIYYPTFGEAELRKHVRENSREI